MNSWFEDEVRLDVFIAPVGNDATDALTSWIETATVVNATRFVNLSHSHKLNKSKQIIKNWKKKKATDTPKETRCIFISVVWFDSFSDIIFMRMRGTDVKSDECRVKAEWEE